MSSGPTYYDFFGVSRTASGEQIRAAYVWLMKQHHPDLTDHADRQRAADFASIVNRSYDVLKDPLKRARYDVFLAREAGEGRTKKVQRVLLPGQTRRARRSRWDASSKGAAALAGAILILVGAAVWMPEIGFVPESQAATPNPSRSPAPAFSNLRDLDVRGEVLRAMSASPQEAEIASEHCFAAAQIQTSLPKAEKCIVFDDAFLDWNRTADEQLSRSVYFSDTVVALRHRNALTDAGSTQYARLDQLKQISVNALLSEIKSQVNAAASPADTADSVDIRDKMSR